MAKKYIDAEKLKESLKRRYTDITVPVITSEGGLESYYRRREIRDIIKLIDSLQQEQPEEPNKSLEEAAEEYATKWHKNPDGSEWKPYFEASAIKAFIAGAQWQKDRVNIDISKQVAAAYQLGEKGKEEQMMKDAVEGYVTLTLTGALTVAATIKEEDNVGIGDKVRIIIVKEKG